MSHPAGAGLAVGADGYDEGQFRAFVGGISWRYTSDDLRAVFEKYGAVGARVMVDKYTNRSRGFGFVVFADQAGLDRAIAEMHDTEIEGKVISVKSAVPMGAAEAGGAEVDTRGARGYDRRSYNVAEEQYEQEGQEYKAFVGGISWQYDADQLREVFRKYGPVDSQVIMDANGRSRGFGFVTFRNERSLYQAINEMNGVELDGKRVSVTRAVPREQTLPGTPAAALARTDLQGDPRYPHGGGRESGRHRSFDRGAYSRGYEREFDMGFEREPMLVRGYERGGYDRGYDRNAYPYGAERDPYYREMPVYEYEGYDRRGYAEPYSRPGYGGDRYRGADRGPDRSRGYAPRPGPYDRRR